MEQPNRVVVTDIDIKFFTMVWLMFKLAFAVLPAALLVTAVSAAFWGFLASLGLFIEQPGTGVRVMQDVLNGFSAISAY